MSEEVLSFEEAIEKYDPVLGFEVHVELNTKTKMFDSAPNEFGDEPNTNVTPRIARPARRATHGEQDRC